MSLIRSYSNCREYCWSLEVDEGQVVRQTVTYLGCTTLTEDENKVTVFLKRRAVDGTLFILVCHGTL